MRLLRWLDKREAERRKYEADYKRLTELLAQHPAPGSEEAREMDILLRDCEYWESIYYMP